MNHKPMVSVVLTAHREGMLLAATLKSLQRSIQDAQQDHYSIEVLISLDRADSITRDAAYNQSHLVNCQIFENNFGDPGMSRNSCVEHASGEFITILDGDDMISRNWLRAAARAAVNDPRPIIWHPEANLVFGEETHMFHHRDMEQDDFDPLVLLICNPWTALAFARKQCFAALPYHQSRLADGFGHEDWSWNRDAIAAGYLHKIVRGTAHAIRRKAMSQLKLATLANALPAPTTLFRQELERRQATRQPPLLERLRRNTPPASGQPGTQPEFTAPALAPRPAPTPPR